MSSSVAPEVKGEPLRFTGDPAESAPPTVAPECGLEISRGNSFDKGQENLRLTQGDRNLYIRFLFAGSDLNEAGAVSSATSL